MRKLWLNYDSTYEVTMRKSRASLEPFWGLKLVNWVLLSLRSTVGSLHVFFLAYVMPWINKARLAGILCCRIRLCDWSVETCRYRGWGSFLDSISIISGAGIDVHTLCWRPFTTCTITLCSYWGYGKVFILFIYTSIKKQLNNIEGWSRDCSANKYTNKICRDNVSHPL